MSQFVHTVWQLYDFIKSADSLIYKEDAEVELNVINQSLIHTWNVFSVLYVKKTILDRLLYTLNECRMISVEPTITGRYSARVYQL